MKRILPIICVLSLIILISGCTNLNSDKTNDIIPADNYVAVYEEYTNTSMLIGNTTHPPIPPYPIPSPIFLFDYNNSTGDVMNVLSNTYVVNDSFTMLFGKMSYLNNPISYGSEGTSMTGVYDLPYIVENGFTIVKITKNGTLYATYNNEPIIISPGDTWESPVTTWTGMGLYHTYDIPNSSNYTVTYISWPVRYNMSFNITNKGIYNKSLLNNAYLNK